MVLYNSAMRGTAELAQAIDSLLPQTQCGRCGYDGCRPYAEAIARGEVDFDQCPPGGNATVAELAKLLGVEAKPLNTAYGEHTPPLRAVIDEEICIGCTKCIQACPVDAILGAAKRMHTVIASECTGCELCVPACPVDCIGMVAAGADLSPATDAGARAKADRARRRFQWRNLRLARDKAEQKASKGAAVTNPAQLTLNEKRAVIKAAVARVKAKKAAYRGGTRST